MRIQDKYSQLNFEKLQNAKADKAKNGQDSNSANSVSEGDSVVLSGKAQQISNLTSAVKSSPDVRQELVADIKEKINAGTYNVSGKQVAEKIVNLSIDNLF